MGKLLFHKFHGTGNDFILIDERDQDYGLDSKRIESLCDRRFGIGADGLIIIRDAKGYDFRMTYYNSDGGEGTMCGNGGRCAVAFMAMNGLGPEMRFLASDGEHSGIIEGRKKAGAWNVVLSLRDVSTFVRHGEDTFFIDTGSPHHIQFRSDVAGMDVRSEGALLRYSREYEPSGTNVNFAHIAGDHVLCRTYERGVEDETLSCGTGVTAVALASHLRNGLSSPVTVKTLGGKLRVSFDKEKDGFRNIWLRGRAVHVFSGKTRI